MNRDEAKQNREGIDEPPVSEEKAKELLRELGISLKYIGSRKGKRDAERLLNKLESYVHSSE